MTAAMIALSACTAWAQDEGMVLIEGGTFQMGSPATEPERDADETLHEVTVADFMMSRTEVSQQEYERVMGKNPSERKGNNLPVENVTWYDAVAYCNALSQQKKADTLLHHQWHHRHLEPQSQRLSPAHGGRMGICSTRRQTDTFQLRQLRTRLGSQLL